MNMDEHHHSEIEEDSEIKDWKKRTYLSWIFAIPIAIFMLSERIFGMSLIPENYLAIVFLVLAFPVVFIFGFPPLPLSLM